MITRVKRLLILDFQGSLPAVTTCIRGLTLNQLSHMENNSAEGMGSVILREFRASSRDFK